MHTPNLKSFISSLILFLCLHFAAARVNAQEAYKIDEVINPRCALSEVPQVTDPPPNGSIFAALDENKDAKLAIVVYGEMEGEARRFAEEVRQWLSEVRGVESERLVMLYGGSSDKLRLELWLVPKGASLPKLSAIADYKKATQFDRYVYKDGESCNNGHLTALAEFAEALKQRSNFQGYIILYRSSRGDGHLSRQQALRHAAEDKSYLIKKFGLPSSQIKTMIENSKWTYAELWLVPPGAEPPAAAAKNSIK